MDAAPSKGPGRSKPGGLLSKAPEAGQVVPSLIEAAAVLLPGIPTPVRIVLLIVITIIALGYGLHLANFLRGQNPLKFVACSTLVAFSYMAVISVPENEWLKLMDNIACLFLRKNCMPSSKKYFVRVHIFQDENGDHIQGAFDKDMSNTYVSVTYMIGQKPHDVGGYTDDRGDVDQILDGPHAITVKVCGITKDDDGNEPLQLTSDNDNPALTLPVKIGIDPEHYKECVHYSAS